MLKYFTCRSGDPVSRTAPAFVRPSLPSRSSAALAMLSSPVSLSSLFFVPSSYDYINLDDGCRAFHASSPAPPTAFTPEPVRRRVAGMKQILSAFPPSVDMFSVGWIDSGSLRDSLHFQRGFVIHQPAETL
jgi:hypothetical protein